jgi:hypothetical protein
MTINHRRKMYPSTLPKITEIEEVTADNWMSIGTIWVTDTGSENTYYIDQFDNQFFCKNYPD